MNKRVIDYTRTNNISKGLYFEEEIPPVQRKEKADALSLGRARIYTLRQSAGIK